MIRSSIYNYPFFNSVHKINTTVEYEIPYVHVLLWQISPILIYKMYKDFQTEFLGLIHLQVTRTEREV